MNNYLTLIERRGDHALVHCVCGKQKNVDWWGLKAGRIKSCGCMRIQALARAATTHGHSADPLFDTWYQMVARCSRPSHRKWRRYGGRGIRVCERWLEFANFAEDMGARPAGKSLERKDNDGDYTPENCKWATIKEQQNNTIRNTFVEYKGERKTISAWAASLGFKENTIRNRVNRGWPLQRAFTQPPNKRIQRRRSA